MALNLTHWFCVCVLNDCNMYHWSAAITRTLSKAADDCKELEKNKEE